MDTEFYKCSDESCRNEPSARVSALAEISVNALRVETKMSLCDECLPGWIAPAGL